jgi:hypothetical protein
MSHLLWISDEDLYSAISELTSRAEKAKNNANRIMHKNVVDPFSSLIIASTLGVDKEGLINIQQSSSTLSGISSALGNFHQRILGAVEGWENHDAGYDLENTSSKMLAEVKNKHNTMNSTNKAAVVAELDIAIRQKGSGWTGYLVAIVPKSPIRYETRLTTAQRPIYEIDGVSFYAKVTGDERALHDLFAVILEELSGRIVDEEIKTYFNFIFNQNIPQ